MTSPFLSTKQTSDGKSMYFLLSIRDTPLSILFSLIITSKILNLLLEKLSTFIAVGYFSI